MRAANLVFFLFLAAQAQAGNTALSFDGASNFVTFGPAPGLGASNFTIECWFKRTATGAAVSTGTGGITAIPLVTKGRGEADGSNLDMNYFFGMRSSDNVLAGDFEGFGGGTNYPAAGGAVITNGNWYHAAATYDGTQWRLYLNGTLGLTVTTNQLPRWDSLQHAGLGTAMTSVGAPSGFFAGLIDEVRIWNYARTAQSITGNRTVEITTAPGLLGRWGLNEGAGTTITSTTPSAITGILSNAPAWVAGFQQNTVTVIAQGDTWKYFKGTSYPAGWETNGFDDSAWLTGPSGFGYSDNDDSTALGDMQNNYLTVFTRKEFIITNPAAITNLTLGADYDDGFVAYLNGVEVARRNVSASPISNTSTADANHEASNGNSSPLAKDYITIPTNALNPGTISTNLLAVSAHNVSLGSSDVTLIIDLAYSTNFIPNTILTRGPYLQLGSHTNITVRWRTDLPATSRVQYGTTTNLGTTVDDLTVTTEHAVRLPNLTPDTRYYYSIGSTNQFLTGSDTNTFFVTNPTPGTRKPTRVWILGDSGTKSLNQLAVASAYYSNSVNRVTDLWLMLGDNVYDAGADVDYDPAIFNVYPNTLRTSVLWPTIGNHDTAQSQTPSQTLPYFLNFSLPTRGEAGGRPSGTENYYSFDYANIHFICLDSMTATNRAANSVMLQWLTLDLQNLPASQKWIIAYWHHPPYTKGSHNSDTPSEIGLFDMRTNAVPILESYGVDLVFCGHSHCYERSYLIDGHYGTSSTFTASMKIDGGNGRLDGTGAYMKPNTNAHAGAVYTVAGSSGQANPVTGHPAMYYFTNLLGSVILDIDGDRLDAKFLTSGGTTNDYFTLLKGSGISIAPTTATASEFGPSNGTFTVTRTGATNFPITVNYTITGTASNGLDYTTIPGNLTLAAGVTTATITIAPIPDTTAEGNETVSLNLATSITYTVAPASNGTVTIQDLPFDAWRAAKFTLVDLTDPSISGDLADPDGDGLVNLLEYALRLEPKTPDANGTRPSVDANAYLTLIYTRPVDAPDVTYTVEGTATVGSGWSSAGIIETEIGNDGTTKTISARDAVPLTGETKRFLRLRVTR